MGEQTGRPRRVLRAVRGEQLREQDQGAHQERAPEHEAEAATDDGRAAERVGGEEQARRSGHERGHQQVGQQQRALPEVATLGLAEEERAVARGGRGHRRGGPGQELERQQVRHHAREQPEGAEQPGREQDEAAQHQPGAQVRLEDQIEEALRALQIEHQQQAGQQQEREPDPRHREPDQRIGGQQARREAERGDQERARRDRLRPQVRGDLPPPRPLGVRDVIDRARQREQIHSIRHRGGRRACPRDRGCGRAIRLARARNAADLREHEPPAALLHARRERGRLRAEIVELGPRALLRLAHLRLLRGDQPRDRAVRIVEIARHDGLDRAHHHARRLEAALHAVGAVVALGRGLGLGVDVERVVGARLHARLAADAAVPVEVHDAVGPAIERHRRADRHAGRVVAVVAAHHAEVAPGVREHALLDVLHPRAVHPQRDLVLLLAGHRAGVTADALALIDDEAVSHVSGSPRRATRAA